MWGWGLMGCLVVEGSGAVGWVGFLVMEGLGLGWIHLKEDVG